MPWLTPLNHQIAHYYRTLRGTWYAPVCGGVRYLSKEMLLPLNRERGERPCQRCVQYVKKRAIAPAEITQ